MGGDGRLQGAVIPHQKKEKIKQNIQFNRCKDMAKSKKDRIISLMMAMLILVSSTGFSIDVHYCQGQLKSLVFLEKLNLVIRK